MNEDLKTTQQALSGTASPPRPGLVAEAEKDAEHRGSPPSRRSSSVKRPPEDIKDHIVRQLKIVYDDVLSQPVPDRFTDLIRQLKAKEAE